MYKEIGKKIKRLAIATFVVEALASIITAIIFLVDEEIWALAILFGGPIVAWGSSWLLYGFGELIDKVCDIEGNIRENNKNILVTLNKLTQSNQASQKYNENYKKNNTVYDTDDLPEL